MRKLFAIAAMAAMAVFAAPAAGWSAETPERGGTLRYGTVTEVSSLDPHIYVGSAWKVLIEALYSTLVGFNQEALEEVLS